MKPSKNGKFPSHQIVFWALNAFVVLLLIAALVRGLTLLRAASVIYGFSTHRPPLVVRVYTKLFRHPANAKDFSIPGKDGPVDLRMVFPSDRPDAPVVVLVHGLVLGGYKDAGLNILATRLAQVGLRVVIPNLPAAQKILIQPSDLNKIGAAIRWSAALTGRRVSLFGVSFGGGLAVVVALQPENARYLNLVLSDAGYNSLNRLGHYYIGDTVLQPDGRHYPPPAQPSSRLLALQYLQQLVPSADVEIFRKRLLLEVANNSGKVITQPVLTPAQQALYTELITAGSPAIREKYRQLLQSEVAGESVLSPHNHLSDLRVPLYVLHGTLDPLIPIGETYWMAHDAPAGSQVHILITPWMGHVALYGQVSQLEKVRTCDFIARLLHAVLHPQGL